MNGPSPSSYELVKVLLRAEEQAAQTDPRPVGDALFLGVLLISCYSLSPHAVWLRNDLQ